MAGMLLMVVVAQGGATPTTQAPADQRPITVTGEKQKPVCRRQVATGSVIPQVVCVTAQQQEQITERSVWVREQLIQQMDTERHVKSLNEPQ